ncbi:hypothetical protein [Desulfofalx alkaliphila]|uniref:hypothetical protein n=1 Tax=Desulfofalx alkaliphila TaxID=105483 RepID=UPI0004E10E9E|nr:hypothetical protein [Desulfofalx alkaliphila]
MSQLEWVKKQFTIMVVLKALGSGLAQIGIWYADMGPAVGIVIMPALIYFIGSLAIRTFVTEERAPALARVVKLFYMFLILSLIGNLASFLINIGYLKTL